MLDLVKAGCENIAIDCDNAKNFSAWLQANFPESRAITLSAGLTFTIDSEQTGTLLFLKSGDESSIYAAPQSAEQILCQIYNSRAELKLNKITALPRAIFFNILKDFGDIKAAEAKISAEMGAQMLTLPEISNLSSPKGALVCFLSSEKSLCRLAASHVLYLEKDYYYLLNYLMIHAPRYLAKAYPTDAWHLVTIRMQDNYEKYTAQYERLTKAIEFLDLGFIAGEQWNRELSPFAEPLGTYGLRLITFMPPLKLKLFLMALEYDTQGRRIVNLDLYYHGKKISWQDVCGNKEYRKLIKGSEFYLPKSILFAAGDDKAKALTYAHRLIKELLTPAETEVLKETEKNILA